MRENNLLAVRNPGRPHGPKAHDGTIKTERVDEMWGTDMTTTMTAREGNASIFLAVDHCSLECVGIHAAKYGTRFEALEPVRQGVRHSFGAFGPAVAEGLTLRHDNGSQYVSSVFQEEISFLGIQSSPSFVREPQGNGIAERFVRTLKENLLWIRRFDTVEELRLALLEFKDTYNREWIIGRHGYKTPSAVRAIQKEAVNVAA
jgi:transposase InsO family protein